MTYPQHETVTIVPLPSNNKMSNATQEHGWTAVPRSLDKLVASRRDPKASTPVRVDDIPLPDSPLAKEVLTYAKQNLPLQTFNHSMRVYYYGSSCSAHV